MPLPLLAISCLPDQQAQAYQGNAERHTDPRIHLVIVIEGPRTGGPVTEVEQIEGGKKGPRSKTYDIDDSPKKSLHKPPP